MSFYLGWIAIAISFICFIGFLATDESVNEKYDPVFASALFLIAAAICFK